MPYDILGLGDRPFTVENPNAVLGLFDNLLRPRQAEEKINRELRERSRLLQSLQQFQLGGEEPAPSTFEDFATRYRGARSRGEGEYPEILLESAQDKHQFRNLRQLVDVDQRIKGL